MAKVLLVEDDNNLREIFEMRLQAEGYETLSASDGEEALVIATKEKPDLIIADVMMPKLSGFEMLETLRAAPDMANVKVIMMTALGQAEDRARGEKLGVVKYLVKSQVTLEDFVRVTQEVLPLRGTTNSQPGAADVQKGQDKVATKQESEHSMQPDNTNPTTPPTGDSSAGDNPISGGDSAGAAAGNQMSSSQEQSVVDNQVSDFAANAPATPPASDDPAAPAPSTDTDSSSFPPATPPAEPPAEGAPPAPEGPATPPAV